MKEPIIIRPLAAEDKPFVMDILVRTGFFTDGEITVAEELIDAWLTKPQQKDYIVRTALTDGGVAGYVCFGPSPATEATWDLYWIAVDPARQGRGIGRSLLEYAEAEISGAGGRIIIIETSSTVKYGTTQNFYLKAGYLLEARIRDFYRPGDDRLIFVKRAGTTPSERVSAMRRSRHPDPR